MDDKLKKTAAFWEKYMSTNSVIEWPSMKEQVLRSRILVRSHSFVVE